MDVEDFMRPRPFKIPEVTFQNLGQMDMGAELAIREGGRRGGPSAGREEGEEGGPDAGQYALPFPTVSLLVRVLPNPNPFSQGAGPQMRERTQMPTLSIYVYTR